MPLNLNEFTQELDALTRKHKCRLVPVLVVDGMATTVLLVNGKTITASFLPEEVEVPEEVPEAPVAAQVAPPRTSNRRARKPTP